MGFENTTNSTIHTIQPNEDFLEQITKQFGSILKRKRIEALDTVKFFKNTHKMSKEKSRKKKILIFNENSIHKKGFDIEDLFEISQKGCESVCNMNISCLVKENYIDF